MERPRPRRKSASDNICNRPQKRNELFVHVRLVTNMKRWCERLRRTQSLRESPNNGAIVKGNKQEQTSRPCCSKSFRSRAGGSSSSLTVVSQRTLTANEKVALAVLEGFNAHRSVVSFFHPAKGEVHFPDAKMTIAEFQIEVDILFRSFPDFHLDFAHEHVKEQVDGSVMVNVFGRGTHTGEPFSFGPFPAIPAKGVFCQNDPE